jgi:hypothetical protein
MKLACHYRKGFANKRLRLNHRVAGDTADDAEDLYLLLGRTQLAAAKIGKPWNPRGM